MIVTSNLSCFILDDVDNKEVSQIIEIKGNKKYDFTSYNFRKDILRSNKGKIKNCNVIEFINDIKNILDNSELYAIAKDSDSWEIEIIINGERFNYFGNFIKDNELMYIGSKNISAYLREKIKIENLFLLDGIK